MTKLPGRTRSGLTKDASSPVTPPAGPLTTSVTGPAPTAALRGDCELRDALAAEDFSGPAYAAFESGLADYAHQLMTALLSTGHIFVRCAEADIYLPSLPIPFSEREDIAQETVSRALVSFKRKGLQEGGWQPEKGASLKTYFNGALIRQFANIWKKRLRARANFPVDSLEGLSGDVALPNPGPADISMQRDEIRRGLADITHAKTRIALVLTEDGYTQEEIAEILGPDVTPRAVEGYLRRHRLRRADSKEGGSQL